MRRNYSVAMLKPSGKSNSIFDRSKPDDASYCEIVAMNIDAKDNIYVIMAFRESDDQPWSFKLLNFDEHEDKKLESLLPFQCDSRYGVRMAVNNDKIMAVLDPEEKILHGGTSCKTNSLVVDNSFHLDEFSDRVCAIRFLDNGTKIIAASYYENSFYIYAEDGEMERKVMIPGEYGYIYSVAINYITKRILVKTDGKSIYLCSFSETGEVKNNVCLESDGEYDGLYFANISNQHGAVALV